MKNFVFYNHTKILFGKDQIAAITGEIPADSRILLIYGGGSIKENGIYDQVIDAISDFEYYEFGGIEPNPSYEKCMEALDVIDENEIDFLLAVGGGSVIDATKFIAAAAFYEGEDPWDILAHSEEVLEALPIGTVLTLPATGSEMNGSAVISRLEYKEKLAFSSPELLPLFSVLDPQVVESLPKRQIENGIVDTFVHVMEQYLTYSVDAKVQDRMAEGIMLTLIEEGPKVLADPSNYNAAANYMWSATMALNSLIGSGVPQDWSTHSIGHEITALHGVDHARTLAIVLPGTMKVMKESKKDKITQYAQRIWGITGNSDDEIVDAAIKKTIDFFESMGIKTRLRDYYIPVTIADEIADRMEQRGDVNIGENKLVGIDEIRKILEGRY
ncbi:MAG: iron-containing alcohol dehydrogenase [Prolixibacteraceae bacterium]|nr:iron-containing alcohol dehydrogenase [Prolixibacteraceae bacterium]MBN2649414.1 iron-containing alcohol dehydrogenase [Prolixibacteraceae bacterium]